MLIHNLIIAKEADLSPTVGEWADKQRRGVPVWKLEVVVCAYFSIRYIVRDVLAALYSKCLTALDLVTHESSLK